MFQFILWGSVFLAALSIFIMLLLIIRRYFFHHLEVKKQARIKILKPMIFSCMENLSLCEPIKAKLSPRDKKLILIIIRQLMETLRGETQENLIKILRKFDAQDDYLQELQNGDESARAQAAENLASFDQDDVKKALAAALNDLSPSVRFSAAYSLERLGVSFDLLSFLENFIRDGAKRPRAMRDFLRKVSSKQASAMMALTRHSNEDIVVLAVDALSQSNDLSIISNISNIAEQHPSKEVRAAAMRTLAALGHPSAQSAVLRALKDPCWEVRAQAAIAAGRIGLVKTSERLSELLSDGQWWVRFRAAESLYTLGPEGIKLIERAADKGGVEGEVAELVLKEKSGV